MPSEVPPSPCSAPTIRAKVCATCRVEKPATEFYRQTGRKDGLQYACKECVKAAATARRLANPDLYRARNHANYVANRDRIKAQNLKWRAANPERCRANSIAWRRANPEKWRAMQLRQRGISPEIYADLLGTQRGVCAICRRPETTADPATGRVRSLSIDHDHACCPGRSCGACIRGLVCGLCNSMLGMAQDHAERLEAAARYLREYRSRRAAASPPVATEEAA